MSTPHRPTPAGPQHCSRFANPGSPLPAHPVRHTIAASISMHTRAAQSSHPGQHNLHTQAAQPFGQTVASNRRPFRQARLDEQPNTSGGAPFEQSAASRSLPRQAPRTDRRFLAAHRFGRRIAHRLGRHNPPDGYSKRPSRTRPAAASNSRAVEAKASRRLVTSVARGSESSAIQTDSTPPSVAARRAERSSNSAKSPS